MGRVTKTIDASVDEIEKAKETAIALMGEPVSKNTLDLFYTDDLPEIESGIRSLNEFSQKSWLLSAIVVYTLIYNQSLYRQSGLTWAEYSMQSRKRLGMDKRDVTEQLSAARFFIKNRAALEKAGYDFSGSSRKLARAELALELCGSLDDVISHLASDTWTDFKTWYSKFKPSLELPAYEEYMRDDIEIIGSKVYVRGMEAVTVSSSLTEQEKERIEKYVRQIFEAMKQGYEPAIIPVYDEKEASIVRRLRDKYRQGK